jgi:hypothetical protein
LKDFKVFEEMLFRKVYKRSPELKVWRPSKNAFWQLLDSIEVLEDQDLQGPVA